MLHGKLYNPNFYITKYFKLLQEKKIYITKSTNKLTKSTGQFRDSMLASGGMLPASPEHNWGLRAQRMRLLHFPMIPHQHYLSDC
jgi:hypothetical protein